MGVEAHRVDPETQGGRGVLFEGPHSLPHFRALARGYGFATVHKKKQAAV